MGESLTVRRHELWRKLYLTAQGLAAAHKSPIYDIEPESYEGCDISGDLEALAEAGVVRFGLWKKPKDKRIYATVNVLKPCPYQTSDEWAHEVLADRWAEKKRRRFFFQES